MRKISLNILTENALKNIFIASLLLLTSLVFVVFPWKTGYLFSGSDLQFHLNRIEELRQAFIVGKYPLVNTLTFNRVGYAINSFYPAISLTPFILIFIIIHNQVDATYSFMLILIFITQIVAYTCAKKVFREMIPSFLFALFYTFSGYFFFVYWFAFDVGEMLAFIAIPPLFLAMISITKNTKQYILLACSLSWITYSHLLTALLSVVYLIIVASIIYTFCKKNYRLTFILTLMKAACLYALLTACVTLPLLNEMINNKIVGPSRGIIAVKPSDLFLSSINNIIFTGNTNPVSVVNIGVVLLVAILFLTAKYHALNIKEKVSLVLGLFTLFLVTNLFPWDFIAKFITSVNILQFTFRLLIFVSLFISFAICSIISRISRRKSINSSFRKKYGLTILLVLAVLISYTAEIISYVSLGKSEQEFNFVASPKKQPIYAAFKVKANNYKQLFGYQNQPGPTDYFPIQSLNNVNSIIRRDVLINSKKNYARSNMKTNQISYNIKVNRSNSDIDLPIILYHFNYTVFDNGKKINFKKSYRGTILIKHVAEGNRRVTIDVHPNLVYIFSIFLSLLTAIIMLLVKIKKNWSALL